MHASYSFFLPSASCLRGASALACVLTCLAGIGFSSTDARADAAACKTLQDAMLANTKTPFHSFASIKFNYAAPMTVAQRNLRLPESQSSETIFTGKAVFVRLLPGKWKSLSTTPTQFQQHVRASVTGFGECRRLADDKVDGAAVSVYQADTKNQNHLVQTKVWVSAQGIPVKSETDIEIGHTPGGDMMHEHLSTRYEYGEVRAPAVD